MPAVSVLTLLAWSALVVTGSGGRGVVSEEMFSLSVQTSTLLLVRRQCAVSTTVGPRCRSMACQALSAGKVVQLNYLVSAE